MGWYYCKPSRNELIDELTNGSLAHCVRGNVLWSVHPTDGGPIIACFLLAKSDGLYGYKDMCESMHPYYFSCPLSYLAMAPVACEAWREGVRNYHRSQAKARDIERSVKHGDTLSLPEGCSPREMRIVSVRPLRGADADGRIYSVPKRILSLARAFVNRPATTEQQP